MYPRSHPGLYKSSIEIVGSQPGYSNGRKGGLDLHARTSAVSISGGVKRGPSAWQAAARGGGFEPQLAESDPLRRRGLSPEDVLRDLE